MGMEIKLTDIRGEPPLKVGEFILDKDNNVMYVGSGYFGLTRNGGAEIGVIARFQKIPPFRGHVKISGISIININTIGKFSKLRTVKVNVGISSSFSINIEKSQNLNRLRQFNANANIVNSLLINIKGGGKDVT